MAGELGELVPVRGIVASPTAVDRFWAKVDKRGEGGCWVWTGATHDNGYGIFNLNGGRTVHAHRWVLAQRIGRDLDRKELACHHCDNRPCVNPDHLFVGSHMDNMADMMRKGRSSPGEGRSRKLTDEKVIAIREAVAAGYMLETVAAATGMSKASICGIARGNNWTHVGGPITKRHNTIKDRRK